MSRYNDRLDELECLASIDESLDYEVDESGIYTDGVKFYFISTSGCSCWDGDDFEESVYNSFEELKNDIIGVDVSDYAPSLKGIRYLITTAELTMPEPSVRVLNEDLSILEWLSVNKS